MPSDGRDDQDREVGEKVMLAHAPGEIPEYVTDRHACSAHDRLSEADSRVEENALVVVGSNHDWRLGSAVRGVKDAAAEPRHGVRYIEPILTGTLGRSERS